MSTTIVVRLDSLGDVLLAGPAVRAVAASSDRVVLLCGPRGAEAAAMLPGVDEILVWNSPWIAQPAPELSSAEWRRLIRMIRSVRADAAVILTSFHQSPLPIAMALRLAGVRRIGGASVDYPGSLLDVRLIPGEDLPEDIPEPVRGLRIAAASGFVLPLDDSGRLALRPLPELPGPGDRVFSDYLVVHPGASVPARRWPAAAYAALVRELADRGHRVLVTGDESERDLTAEVAGDAGTDLGGRTPLPEMARLLRDARLLVCSNTGPAHLAAAVGTPVVSLYSPVLPAARWAPYGVPVELLGDQLAPCRGSRARECPVAGHPCLASVSPAEVVAACERLLALSAQETEVGA